MKFKRGIEETLSALRFAAKDEEWPIGEEVYDRLLKTAPGWPEGRDSYRSLRIRFGEGDEGVAQTFEAHAARIKRIHGDTYWRWEYLLSGKKPYQGEDVERLRLLGGNQAHKPVIEWCVVDLDANRRRKNITSVRGQDSLADEGLVIAWLYPTRVLATSFQKCAWFLGKYELNVPEFGGESWQGVPFVSRSLATGKVCMAAHGCDNADSVSSVPRLRE